MRAGEVDDARFAELPWRGGAGVPDEPVDAVAESGVGPRLERRGIRRPVGLHVGEGLDGRQGSAVDVRGHGGVAAVAATDLRCARPPELALRHVVAAPECQRIGVLEQQAVAAPRPPRLGVPLHARLVAQVPQRPIAIVHETITERPAVVAQEPLGDLLAVDGHSRQHRQIRPETVTAILLELPVEAPCPRRYRAFPTHAVEVCQRASSQRAGVLQDRSPEAAEMGRYRACVQHVHVGFGPFRDRRDKAEYLPATRGRLPGELALGVSFVGQVNHLHGRGRLARFGDNRPSILRVIAESDRLALRRRRGRPPSIALRLHPHCQNRHVP